ncbi:MAG: aminotransferase class I/II-fold pyridoxal phosphate-dependent enzyme [Oscillospiraceae bacterium]|nr:aminotransferase class I/II-fold pyridoxal phosphate-dependent enzyme [Oscillospiraceae bacterium]
MTAEQHGGNIFANPVEYDFSANLNPLGLPESVRQAVFDNSDLWEHYPDPYCIDLRKAISEHENYPAEKIICGNGADDLLYRIVQAFRPEKALICAPAFGEYRKALTENQCSITEYLLDEKNSFLLTESFLNALTPDTDMLILCHPNNPTGRCIPAELLGRIAEICNDNKILLLCDECFLDFVPNGISIRNFMHENIIILKAFTKIYAMAGLRLGYALTGSPEHARKIQQTGQFWSVSAPAQTAGISVLKEKNYLEKTLKLIQQEREFLQSSFSELKIKYYPSDANFILFRAETNLKTKLLSEKILIRECSNYTGLDDTYYRIAVRNHQENQVLISALRRCLHG